MAGMLFLIILPPARSIRTPFGELEGKRSRISSRCFRPGDVDSAAVHIEHEGSGKALQPLLSRFYGIVYNYIPSLGVAHKCLGFTCVGKYESNSKTILLDKRCALGDRTNGVLSKLFL